MPKPPGQLDRRHELLLSWERHCRVRGDAAHCTGADALFLVTAVSTALRRASETPELGRAARTWGARFSAPVDALASLSALRAALTELAEDSPEGLPVPLSVLHRVFDQATMEAVDAASANLRSAARNDPLTGCANRRALDEDLTHAAASARRSNLDLAVAVVDLDGLKQINDTHGHAAGDRALVDLVSTLRRALREADTLYRTGGDEFVVVAPFTDAAGARALMRRAEQLGGPSFSWGVASLAGGPGPEPTVLMDAADSDLYERRRSTRRAALLAERRRRATAVASVAASVAVTASMAGLAVALDSGTSLPPTQTASATNPSPEHQGGWPTGAIRAPTDSHMPSAERGPGTGGADSTTGVNLAGILGTVVSPSLLVPVAPPGSPASDATTMPTIIVPTTSAQPIALASLGSGGTITTTATVAATAPSSGGTTAGSTGPGNGAGHGGGHDHGPATAPGRNKG